MSTSFDLIRDTLYDILANGSDGRWRHPKSLRYEASRSIKPEVDHIGVFIPMAELMLALGELEASGLVERMTSKDFWRHIQEEGDH